VEKWAQVADVVLSGPGETVLDVGCRDGILGRVLDERAPGRMKYTGLDFKPGPGVDVVGDLSKGLTLGDDSYDIVTAIDVLEHLDDLQGGLDEVLRIARYGAVVLLPNTAHFLHRTRFLVTGRIGGKYDLAIDYGPDRHRWLTVIPQIDDFMQAYAARHGYALEVYDIGSGARRSTHLEKLMRAGHMNRALYVYACCYRVTIK
jgi:ubiquinone/menaquinone biosynthesis C-methylase UbiE